MIKQYLGSLTISFCVLLVLSINPVCAFEIEQNQYHYNSLDMHSIENTMHPQSDMNISNVSIDNQVSNEESAKKFLKEDQHSTTSNVLYGVFYTVMIVSAVLLTVSIVGGMYASFAAPTALAAGASEEAVAAYTLSATHYNTLRMLWGIVGSGGILGGLLSGYILYS